MSKDLLTNWPIRTLNVCQFDGSICVNHVTVHTLNPAKRAPQLTVFWYTWDGKDFSFTTLRERAKYVNIKRNPAISLIVDDSSTHTSVTAYGQAEIVEQHIAELLRPIIEKYVAEAQREETLKGMANDPNRVIVVLHPEKIIP